MNEINKQPEPEYEIKPITQPTSPEPEVKLITKSKFGDFMLGFVVFGLIHAAIAYHFFYIHMPEITYIVTKVVDTFFLIILVLIINGIGIYIFKKHYKYVMFGILSLMIYPLLLFGSCFVR